MTILETVRAVWMTSMREEMRELIEVVERLTVPGALGAISALCQVNAYECDMREEPSLAAQWRLLEEGLDELMAAVERLKRQQRGEAEE